MVSMEDGKMMEDGDEATARNFETKQKTAADKISWVPALPTRVALALLLSK